MSDTELKELRIKRGSIKGRLTNFKNHLQLLKGVGSLNVYQVKELRNRLSKLEELFSDYDTLQTNLEIKESASETPSESILAERYETENIFYNVIAEAQELLESNEVVFSNATQSIHNSQSCNPIANNIKLPIIKLPTFCGDPSKWLEFHDTFSSLIHENNSISNVMKYQYLKGSLTDSAASVIESLELTDKNYEVAWKLVCDRFNNKGQLVHTHLKALFDIPIGKECERSLRFIIDHISKNLRALHNLGEQIDNWDTLIIFMYSAKLDPTTCTKWEEYKSNLSSKITLDNFYDFLRKRADVVEMLSASSSDSMITSTKVQSQSQVFKRIDRSQKAFVATSYDGKQYNKPCMICGGSHLIYYCKKFLSMSPADRYQHITKLKACVNCLRSGHFANQCRSGHCNICKGKHNSLLHSDRPKDPVQSVEEGQTVSKSISLSTCIANQVLLSTAIVTITNNDTKQSVKARCLLDSGSQSSFISQDLKDKLSLKSDFIDSVCVTGVNNMSFQALQRCNIQVQSHTNKFKVQVNAFVLNQVTSALPSHEVDISSINIPQNIQLADPDYFRPAKIDLLIGADLFWDVICTEQIKLGTNKPILQNSMFGWLVAGPVMCSTSTNAQIACNFSQDVSSQLRKFWELEEVPVKPVLSPEEEACEQHFVEHTQRLEDGRFCVKLPLKTNPDKLGDSYYLARKRFESLERRFQRHPEVKQQYVSFIQEYIDLGHASEIERPEKAVILPHHPVLKEQSDSSPCRVVFDASAKTCTGLSLNDTMMVGPTVQDDIFSILTRFREHTYILTGDIEKMYRQILIHPSQRHLQVILWRENENEPMRYLQLNTVTYGTSSAPFLSTRCLNQLALECQDPVIKQVMLHDFYVDDLNTGHSDETNLKYIYEQVTEKLKSAGFNLRKIKSNSTELLKFVSNNCHDKQDNLKLSTATNILGIEWDPNIDCILMSVSKLPKHIDNEKCTKRKILSISSSIFDPLGLLSVCIITCKMILQLLWAQNVGWDDQIPSTIREIWHKFITNLACLRKLTIPRHAICANPILIELHAFTDASLKAYAACVYVRSIDALGNVTVRLLTAKSKVAPLKATTIPRLELCGALLGSRLCHKVSNTLRCSINKKYFWCDSKIVLGWLSLPSNKLSTFVSHRVAEVNDLCSNASWHYVPSSCNPADLASRGVYPDEVQSLSLWWEGPAFLKCSIDNWPTQAGGDTQTNLPEIRTHAVTCSSTKANNSIIQFEKHSSFIKLRRIMAYVCRFINNCKTKDSNSRNYTELNVDELTLSEIKLSKLAQSECFSNLKDDVKNLPSLHSLSPFIDENDIIRVGGRIDNSDYLPDKKHPIVIDSKHHYSKLLFEYYHIKLMHAGPQLLLSVIREHYWPLGGRVLAKKICQKCIVCKRLKAVTARQIMGHLPPQRVNPGFPFEVTGTDYAGPFLIASKKGRGARLIKAYLCVFICFKTKAVHLELVSDLSTEAFILALRRFMSRRGKPREIFCDNGTNFVGANRALAQLVENCSNSVSDLANEGIKFKFSPAYSPHYGGLYESAVKVAKFHMKRVVGNTHLTFEELTTLFSQIEAIMNSRPLCPLSSDPSDLCPLTPGHFLVGRPLTSLPSPDLQEANPSRLHRFARIEQARQHFWSRWSQEYICELQQRTKWQTRHPNLKLGQMVLIKDERCPPLKWPLGRITSVHPGPDGAVRVVDIRTSQGTVRRALNRICPLLEEELASSQEGGDC